MLNNKIDKIAIKTANKKTAFFNWSCDNYTTCNIGEMQPTMCKLVPPDTKIVAQRKDLIRLAPLVRPCFTRMSRKDYYSFVSFSELSENFAHMMAQTPVSRGWSTYYPAKIPHITRGMLSMLVLIGAKVTLWTSATDGDLSSLGIGTGNGTSRCCPVYNATSATALDAYFLKHVNQQVFSDGTRGGEWIFKNGVSPSQFSGFKGTVMRPDILFMQQTGSTILGRPSSELNLQIPIANSMNGPTDAADFFDGYEYLTDPQNVNNRNGSYIQPIVRMEKADYIISTRRRTEHASTPTTLISYAFRLSDFGKRLRKVLIGCGYQIDFTSTEQVSLMPLFAVFKAYYEMFGLKLYDNYYTTPLYKLLTYADYNNLHDFNTIFNFDVFGSFITALGNLWATEQQDYISAHITSTAVSPSTQIANDMIDVPHMAADGTVTFGTPNVTEVAHQAENATLSQAYINAHSYINSVTHGQLDCEFLKRLYRWTNRNTPLGQVAEKLLRAQGLGEFCDSCKSHFIGFEETPINVMDVVSTSDTVAASGEGMTLGDYAGRGLGWKKKHPKTFSYKTAEYGYFVCLTAIVPNAGYVQQLDPTLQKIDKFELYNPEFDGLGYEATTKSVVVGEQNIADDVSNPPSVDDRLDATFGFIPRYTGLKVATSKLNGDFSRRSTRSRHLTYNSDKYIPVNEKQILPGGDQPGLASWVVPLDLLTPSRVPVAGNVWRYINRYPYLSNFERIFVNQGIRGQEQAAFFDPNLVQSVNNTIYEYIVANDDNFMLFDVNDVRAYWQALPIERSFETYDEENEKPNAAVTKE